MRTGLGRKATRMVAAAVAATAMIGATAQAQTLKVGIIGSMTGGGAAWGLAAAEASASATRSSPCEAL